MSFYNTTVESGQILIDFNQKARNQDEAVMGIFALYGKELTPCECHERLRLMGYNFILTSVRRSINTLTKSGMLRRVEVKREGIYGRPNTCWVVS